MNKKFTRTIEDFICEHCQQEVRGNGYTNHCPFCLWSKHVDVNPGDRANLCQGMMIPIKAYYEAGQWHLIQNCSKCGHEGKIKFAGQDKNDALEEILGKMAKGNNKSL